MPGPRRDFRHLPHVLDNLSLVKRFVEEVPVTGRKWRGFQRAAAEALDEVFFIFLPAGLVLPCPKRVLPKPLEPYLATLPCKTKVMQRTVEGNLAAMPLRIPVCRTIIPQKMVQPMLTAELRAMPLCKRTVLPRNVRPGVIRTVPEVKPAPRRKK
jgi:hypothetical protein